MNLLDIGLSGLNSARTRLETAGHNVANVAVQGFSRREVLQSTCEWYPADQQVMLAGTRIDDIRRVTSDFLVDQRHATSADYGDANEFSDYLKRLDAYLGNDYTGVSSSVERFVSALSAAEAEPASTAYRQQIISEAAAMAVKFNNLGRVLVDFSQQVDDQLGAISAEASALSDSVATLNRTIRDGYSRGAHVTDLEDQRDHLINQLTTRVGVQSLRQPDGMISLFFRSGQSLVQGECGFGLMMPHSAPDAMAIQPQLNRDGSLEPLRTDSGELHGLARFRSEVLLPALNTLGWQAAIISAGNNRILAEGQDLSGNPGAALFNDVNAADACRARVIPEQVSGSTTATLAVDTAQLAELKPSDYRLWVTEQGGQLTYTVQNMMEDREVASGTLDATTTTRVTFEGLVLELSPGSKKDDSYLLTPWRNETAAIRTVLSEPDRLGLAATGNGPGDNSNLSHLMTFMQSERFSAGTLPESSDRLLGRIATRSWQATQQAESLGLLKQEADSAWESRSGVNLDEEAGDLMRFQQHYQGNARVLSAAQRVLDTLLSL